MITPTISPAMIEIARLNEPKNQMLITIDNITTMALATYVPSLKSLMRVGVFIALYEEASDDCGNDSDSRKGKRGI